MIYNLQALRAFAALLVAFHHIKISRLGITSFSVDVLFVISGFMMSHLCWVQPRDFLLRRISRIVPMYWLLTGGVFLVALAAPELLNATTANITNLVQSLFFIPYFKENGTITLVLPVGWTLNYQMFFYLMVAVCLKFVQPRRATIAASILLFSIIVFLKLSDARSVFGIFYADYIVLEFGLGVAAFWFWKWFDTRAISPLAYLLALLCASVCLVISELAQLNQTVPFGRGLAYGIPASVKVTSAICLDACWPVRNQLLLFLGKASYSIYLSHLFVIEFMRKVFMPKFQLFDLDHWMGIVIALVAVCCVGGALHQWVEMKIHRFLKTLLNRNTPWWNNARRLSS